MTLSNPRKRRAGHMMRLIHRAAMAALVCLCTLLTAVEMLGQGARDACTDDAFVKPRTTEFFVPPPDPNISADHEFSGNDPDVTARASLKIEGGQQVILELFMDAREPQSDWTRAVGHKRIFFYESPEGWGVDRIATATLDTIRFRTRGLQPNHVLTANPCGSLGRSGRSCQLVNTATSDDGLVEEWVIVGDSEETDDVGSRTGVQVRTHETTVVIIREDCRRNGGS
jgi:hypothetical protein